LIRAEGIGAFAAAPAEVLAVSYDFSRHRRLLDLGGGVGSFLVPALRRHDGLQGTLFELPGAAAVARQLLDREPEGKRVEVVAGDFFKDPIPPGHDAIIIANVVHVFSPEHNRALFRAARAAATPQTRLLIVDMLTDSTHTQPVFAALAAGEFLVVAGEGDVYSEEELREWLLDTGWQPLEHKPLTGPTSLLVAAAKGAPAEGPPAAWPLRSHSKSTSEEPLTRPAKANPPPTGASRPGRGSRRGGRG